MPIEITGDFKSDDLGLEEMGQQARARRAYAEAAIDGDLDVGLEPITTAAVATLAAPLVKSALISAGKSYVAKKGWAYTKKAGRKVKGWLTPRWRKRKLTAAQKAEREARKAERKSYKKAQDILASKILASRPTADAELVAKSVRMAIALAGMSPKLSTRQKIANKLVKGLKRLKISVNGPVNIDETWSPEQYKTLRDEVLAAG